MKVKERVLRVFESRDKNIWATTKEISKKTGISINKIEEVIKDKDFVESFSTTLYSEKLYTSKKLFKRKANFFEKLIRSIRSLLN